MSEVTAVHEKPNGAPAGPPESTGPAKSGFQKRIDKLTREKHEANQRHAAEVEELRADLERALRLIQRYRAERKLWLKSC